MNELDIADVARNWPGRRVCGVGLDSKMHRLLNGRIRNQDTPNGEKIPGELESTYGYLSRYAEPKKKG